jgi:hypothetical protein
MISIPEISRAAVLRKFKASLAIENVPIPREVEDRAVLAKIEVCSICAIGVHRWQVSPAQLARGVGDMSERCDNCFVNPRINSSASPSWRWRKPTA